MTTLVLDTGFKNQFNDRLRDLVQQVNSKLRDKVNIEMINGEYQFLDKIGKVSTRKDNNTFAPISNQQASYERRRLSHDRFVFDYLFDKNQMRKLVNDSDYQSKIVSQMKSAYERDIDRVIKDSFLATAYTGKNGSTAITASADGVVIVDASAGTTYEKLREAKRTLASRGYNVSDGYNIFHTITEEEQDTYEQELELVSSLYTGNNAVMRDTKSQMVGALGINFIIFPSNPIQSTIDKPMLDVTSSVRDCFFFVGKNTGMGGGFPGAVTFGMERSLEWEFDKLPEKHDTWVLKAQMNMGAVREHGEAIIHYKTPDL